MRRPSPLALARIHLEGELLEAEAALAGIVQGMGGAWTEELVRGLARRDAVMAALLLLPKATT